jgi:subfamily B ATP-binding cassette protein MsbA
VTASRRLAELLHPYRSRLGLGFLFALLTCLLSAPVGPLIGALIDSVWSGAAAIAGYTGLLLAVFAAQAAAGLLLTWLIGEVGLAVVRDLRYRLYARLQRLSLAYYDRTPAGAIISQLTDDVAAVQNLITAHTLTIVTDLATAGIVSVWLLVQSSKLFFAAAACVPVYLLLFRVFSKRIREGSALVRANLDGLFARLKEKLDGMLVVKAHARETEEVRAFSRQIDDAHAPRLLVGHLSSAFSNLSATVGGIGAALVFTVGALEVLQGRMTPGGVVSATALTALLFGPISRLADLAGVFQQSAASLDRLGEVLDQEPDVVEPTSPVALGRPRGLVEFDGVTFAYRAGCPVLHDVRFRIEPGTKVALVGPTGCGKSTLIHLLLRFYDPTHGEIRLDGVGLTRLSSSELRQQIGVVPQEPVIFRASVADNIRFGVPQASAEQVEAAARAARAHEFIAALPGGYATLIGPGGCKLSQGERQRLAIARAFCKGPALVLLDEATSSLDLAGEALLQDALEDLLAGRTAIIVAHRLSTILDADLIVVMNHGRIVQMGAHAELIKDKDGQYYRLYARQFTHLARRGKKSRRQASAPLLASA